MINNCSIYLTPLLNLDSCLLSVPFLLSKLYHANANKSIYFEKLYCFLKSAYLVGTYAQFFPKLLGHKIVVTMTDVLDACAVGQTSAGAILEMLANFPHSKQDTYQTR